MSITIRVKYLSEEAIEKDAEALLAEFAHARSVDLKPPIPIEDIVEKHLKLRIEFDNLHDVLDIPQEGLEPDILGAIWVDRREICLDQCLDPEERPNIEGRYRFTLAHEGGGHWRLHRRYLASDPNQAPLFADEARPAVVCRSSQSKERVEWQADFYASCLLMPRSMVAEVWQKRFGNSNPRVVRRKNRMPIFESDDPGLRDLKERFDRGRDDEVLETFLKPFAELFLVSPIAMRIRLEKLGLLHREVRR